MTIDDIRAAYPNPIRGHDAAYPYKNGAYCVGGAYCQSMGYRLRSDLRFPTRQELARIMSNHIPGLDYDAALAYATEITRANDNGNFEEAWRELEEALHYNE